MIPLTDRELCTEYIDKNGNITKSAGTAFKTLRRYSQNQPASHLIGYSSSDGRGLSGLEKKFDSILSTDIRRKIEYDASGTGGPIGEISTISDADTDSKNTDKLVTSVDYHIQKIAEDALREYIPKGAAVVLDVNSFDVLAMASTPEYDYSSVDSKNDGQLLNRALCEYNAGSIFKIITTAALLESDSQAVNKTFICDGKFTGDGVHVFNCNKPDGHKLLSLTEAFAHSCNCAFYETSLSIGGRNLIGMASEFGLGEKLAAMGDEEACGNIPFKETYTANEVINLSIGQGEIMITPLQCAAVCATVANGGVRKNVNLVHGIYDIRGSVCSDLRIDSSRRVISEQTAAAVSMMMRECVLSGTASEAGKTDFKVAGKTGSAESGWLTENGELAVHGWFCGFFPYDNPMYAVSVFCEDGKSGAQSCIKPFIKICEEINKIYPFIQ